MVDPRLTFDGVVEEYDRARPSYPDALITTLFEVLPPKPRVLEVGPGTGQLTQLLLDRGAHVTAVELGPNLAAALTKKFSDVDRLTVLNAAFETAPVAAGAFDAVVTATAYHWVQADAQISRPIELLRPGGYLGIVDLIQVDEPADLGYFDRVQAIYDRYGQGKTKLEPTTYNTAQPKIADYLSDSERYAEVQVHRHRWDQRYSTRQYRDLLWSYSGTQMMTEPERTQMVDELVAVIDDEFGGVMVRPLVATLTLARPN